MLQQAKWKLEKLRLKKHKAWGNDLPLKAIKLSFCEQNTDLAVTLAEVFAQIPTVEVVEGNVFQLSADALVSPANSFGDMSGGLDKAIDDFYQGEAQTRAQAIIRNRFYGELPVGQAVILEMSKARFPHLCLVPTMRIPSNVSTSINAYLAMRALLISILEHNYQAENPIQHIALTSFCTGIGGMPFREAAEQLLVAYDMIIHESWKEIVHPAIAAYATKKQN